MRQKRRILALGLALGLFGVGGGCSDPAEEEEALAPCEVLLQLQSRAGGQISGPPGRLNEYRIEGAQVRAFIPSGCSAAVASRLESSACAFCNLQPGQCEALVREVFAAPPLECSPCGDGQCDGGETALLCPIDCASTCGDGLCDVENGEGPTLCPIDCVTPCGNGLCDGDESPETCPDDCNFSVGDGICSGGESFINSPNDCGGDALGQPCASDAECRGKVCVNNACTCRLEDAPAGEQVGVCSNSTCGDTYCQSHETGFTCAEDCCPPVACEAPGQRGCQGDDVVVCTDDTGGPCLGVEILERCEFGCLGGRCQTCPQELASVTFCEAPGMRCSGDTLILCEPFPGLAGCFSEQAVDCRAALEPSGQPLGDAPLCTLEGCRIGCPEAPCQVGAVRCSDDGRFVEQCRDNAGGSRCIGWQTLASCQSYERCNAPEQRCDAVEGAITSTFPLSARVGDVITLQGYGFGPGAGEVYFTPNLASTAGVWEDGVVTTAVPQGALTGPIVLVTRTGLTLSSARLEVLP